MMLTLLWTCGLICAAFADVNDEVHRAAMENPDLFGGDMLDVISEDRNVIPQERLRWTDATVPYIIDPSLSQYKDLILKAIKDYHDNTCVEFVPHTTEKNHIRMFAGKGCYSNVGMIGGQQQLSLGTGCHFVGTIVHEIGHALGFWHEQNRSDRDDHLEIYLENVEKGMEFNFLKLRADQNLLLTPFDHHSIMIYGNTAFSKDNKSFTMKAKNGTPLLNPYSKDGMTDSDIKRINTMYNCVEA